jgi:branched-chain amino acid transport system permease protein
MSAVTVDLSEPASPGNRSPFRRALGVGLILGVIAVYGATVGILPLMNARWVIVDAISLGDAALITIGLSAGAVTAARMRSSEFWPLVAPSLVAGGVAGGLLALLALAMQAFPLRQIFIALSPDLLKSLTFGLGASLGGAVLIVAGALLAVLGAALTRAPEGLRKPVTIGLAFVTVFGVFQELIQIMMQSGGAIDALRQSIYTW